MKLGINDTIFGKWKIDEAIGSGSFGTVYKISKQEYNKTYVSAAKVLTIPNKQDDYVDTFGGGMSDENMTEYYKSLVDGIIDECDLMEQMKGDSHIVSYEDHTVIESEDKKSYMILIRMELLTPFVRYAKEHELSKKDVVQLGIDICQALETCQNMNVIHRDIKPENIFVSNQNKYKLGDFGISKVLGSTEMTLSRKGTQLYMAPEVYLGKKYNLTADIYSLGLVLYILMNHKRAPFLPPYPQTIRYEDTERAIKFRMEGEALPMPSEADEEFGRVILKSMEYDPAKRYSSAKEMRQQLEKILDQIELGQEDVKEDRDKKIEDTKLDKDAKLDNSGGTVGIFSTRGLGPLNLEEEEVRLAEEKRKAEEAARLAEEKRKVEEAARLAEEKRKVEEVARLAEEKRKAEEAARLAEEKRKAEEAARLAEEKRKAEEVARLAEEKRKAEEAARLAEEKRKAEEVARLAEEKRKAQEAARLAEEKRKAEAAKEAQKIKESFEKTMSIHGSTDDGFTKTQGAVSHTEKPKTENQEKSSIKLSLAENSNVKAKPIHLKDEKPPITKKVEEDKPKDTAAILKQAEERRKAEEERRFRAIQQQEEERRKKVKIMIGAVAGVIAIVAIALIVLLNGGTAMPEFSGMTQEEACNRAKECGFEVMVVNLMPDDTVPEGCVISQNIEAGKKCKEGTEIELNVSQGSIKSSMPNFVGMTTDQLGAEMTLVVCAQEQTSWTSVYRVDAMKDVIVAQNPPEGTALDESSVITFVVSKGPATMTSVVGMSQDEAIASVRQLLESDSYEVTITPEESDSVPAGSVISQSIEEGQSIGQDSALTLVVSAGSSKISVPNVAGKSQSKAIKALTQAGFDKGNISTSEEYSDSVKSGSVISQSVAEGSSVEKGSKIALVISKGSEPKATPAPTQSTPSKPDSKPAKKKSDSDWSWETID